MIRQITLVKFKPDVSRADIGAMGAGFSDLTDVVGGIRRFEFGPDLGLEETTLDYALVIDFETADDWRAYRAHPKHVAFARKFIPLTEKVERVQYRIDRES